MLYVESENKEEVHYALILFKAYPIPRKHLATDLFVRQKLTSVNPRLAGVEV